MSSIYGIDPSASTSYGVQLAQTSALQRSLYNLGSAVQNGNLAGAKSNLAAIIKANPQYAANGSGSSSNNSTDPINEDFQTLANALDKNDLDGAKNAWAKIKSDLTKDGVPAIQSPTANAAAAVAQSKAQTDQELLSTLLGASPATTTPDLMTLLGAGNGNATPGLDSVNSLVSNWLSYQADGTTSPATTTNPALSLLNTAA